MKCYPGLMLRILGADYPAMGPGKARLVELIDQTGSISAAAREMGMSYRRAWQLVDALNGSFRQAVVVTAVGGKRGGGAKVSDFGRKLVESFREMESKATTAIAPDVRRFSAHLRRRPGGKPR